MTAEAVWPADLQRIHLQAGTLHVDLAPEIGGAIAAFYSQESDDAAQFHWLRPASSEALAQRKPTGMASYPLIPFCNRIRHGRFNFAGRDVQLPLNVAEPHVLHGFAWQRPWQCIEQSARYAVLQLEHAADAWPWPFVARQSYTLGDAALHIEISVTNTGDVPMPIGIGHHPYVPHRHGTRLQADVVAMWEGDNEVMPTRLSQPPLLDALRTGTLLAQHAHDNNFTGWRHHARVDWPHENAALTLRAEWPLDFFVLYSPADQDHFCIEAVSNCTDWLNLRSLPQRDIGGQVLAPGDTLTGRQSLAISLR